jgi:uncharacterized protein with FMN-binding domain
MATPPTNSTSRRRHPSRGARAVALVTSLAATGGIGAALAHAEQSTPTVLTQAASSSTASTTSTPATTAAAASGTASAGTPSTTATTAASGSAYADGTYTGDLVTMRYGPMQVQVTVSGGKVTGVAVLQEPGDGRSQRINAEATPILESQAVAVQTAGLDGVSGATYTTASYEASLQSALDAAHAAQASQG